MAGPTDDDEHMPP
jgi:hypothetical protein